MKILVCVKQVPDTTEIKIDPVNNTLIREGVQSILNPFDGYALETAVRFKEKYGGVVTVICMGPPQAKSVLKECLSVGADSVYLVSDRAFGGSDTLATSFILSEVIKYLGGFDLIFCGKQAIDGDTGQVGPELAEHLGLAQVTYVADLSMEDNHIISKRENENGYEIIKATIPTVITIIKTDFEPRYPTIKSKMAANKAEIPVLTAQDISIDANKAGLKGSATKVKSTFVPVRNKSGIIISGKDSEESATELADLLSNAHLI